MLIAITKPRKYKKIGPAKFEFGRVFYPFLKTYGIGRNSYTPKRHRYTYMWLPPFATSFWDFFVHQLLRL